MYNVLSPFPTSESVLCYFVVSLGRQGLAPGTIRTYLAAVRHEQIVRGLPEVRQNELPRLQLVKAGVRRERALQGMPQTPRLPITPAILRRLREAWVAVPGPGSYNHTMLWAAASMCFFGFFRSGEITVQSAGAFDPRVHLSWGDVSVDGSVPPSKIRVFLKRSKTDQFGRGVEVFVGATGDALCPVQATVAYSAWRGVSPGPFFRTESGIPLTKAKFVDGIRLALTQAGIATQGYSGHSFRIGAATAAASAGIQDSVIQQLGRWSSSAFLAYIRTPRDALAGHAATLSGSTGQLRR